MKIIRIDEYGGPEVLRLREIELPEPGPGEVRVRLHAAGVNFVDIYYRRGDFPAPLPFTLGSEGAGVVEAIGGGVEDFKPGDRVAYTLHPGSYAEASIVPANLFGLIEQATHSGRYPHNGIPQIPQYDAND